MIDGKHITIAVVSTTCATISFLSSAINILLIKSMGKWNGYLAIIWTMEICQMFYDLSFAMFKATQFKTVIIAIQFFGGLSVALWTNVLSIILLHVVVNTQSIDILKHFNFLSLITIGPAIALSAIYIAFYDHRDYDKKVFTIYYALRLMSIILNFSIFVLIKYKAHSTKSNTASTMTSAEAAIRVLSRRVVYYPILQAITILPAVAYEFFYGLYDGLNMQTDSQFASALIFLLVAPCAGIGYLTIFLIMQPNAYKHFMIKVNYIFETLNCCCKKNRQHEDDRKVNVFGVLDNGIVTTNKIGSTGRLSQLFSENDSNDDAQLLFDRFAAMEEDELVKEINNSRTDSKTSSNTGTTGERKSSVDGRSRAEHFSI